MKTLKRKYSKSYESLVDTKNKNCQYCFLEPSTYIRKLDISKIPNEYFVNQNDYAYQMIMSHPDTISSNKFYFINLPHKYVLTKYPTYACYNCYLNEFITCLPWNYWEKL